MHHTDHRTGRDAVAHPDARDDIPLATTYTTPCRRCGQRIHLAEDELVTSLTSPPLCWRCENARPAATSHEE